MPDNFNYLMNTMIMNDFEEYIRQGEPDKKEKGIIWQTAIGLQQVDGLKPSAYLLRLPNKTLKATSLLKKSKIALMRITKRR